MDGWARTRRIYSMPWLMFFIIMAHPVHGHGERRPQLVQIPDVYATVLAAIDRPIPPYVHGVNLLPVLEDATAPTRGFILAGF